MTTLARSAPRDAEDRLAALSLPGADLLLIILLALTGLTASLWAGRQVPAELLLVPAANDTWFEADTPRVVSSAAHHPGKYGLRYFLHPLFSELTYPFTQLLQQGLGMSLDQSIRTMVAVTAGLWLAGVFCLLRLAGLSRPDALLMSALAAVSASAMAWLIVPETHAMGSLGILAAMLLVAVVQFRRRQGGRREPVAWHVAAHLATLGFTISGWMAGLAATWVIRRRRWPEIVLSVGVLAAFAAVLEPMLRKLSQRWIELTAGTTQMLAVALIMASIALLLALRRTRPARRIWIAVRRLVNRPGMTWLLLAAGTLTMLAALAADRRFLGTEYAVSPLHSAGSFVYHTMVMPQLRTDDRYDSGWPILITQHSAPGSAGPWGASAVVVWSLLLALAIVALTRRKQASPLLAAALLVLLGQFALHLFYGEEVFLYSMNWTPLLVLLAAVPLLDRRLHLAGRTLTVLLIACLLLNNPAQLHQALNHVQSLAAP